MPHKSSGAAKKTRRRKENAVPGPGHYNLPALPSGRTVTIPPLPSPRILPPSFDTQRSGTPQRSMSTSPVVEREKRPDPWQYNIPSLFEAPQSSWSPRCPIHGSPRKAAIVSGVDIFHISKLPGPGQYFVRTDPRSFTGRDRSPPSAPSHGAAQCRGLLLVSAHLHENCAMSPKCLYFEMFFTLNLAESVVGMSLHRHP